MNAHDNFLRLFKLLGPTDLGTGPGSRAWSNPGLTRVERDNVVSLWRRRSAQWKALEDAGAKVRPSDLFDPSKRGRIDAPGGSTAVNSSISWPAGASLLAFTDGITEAGSKVGLPQFQGARLQAALAAIPPSAASARIVADLRSAVAAHVGLRWPDDDATAVCLQHS
ncbi:MAG: serine/threonine-protein phosphatase [Gemmataceae bacterium]|nr:serine/threonine-protein phosphatase [Gemmataceae bacterium]